MILYIYTEIKMAEAFHLKYFRFRIARILTLNHVLAIISSRFLTVNINPAQPYPNTFAI